MNDPIKTFEDAYCKLGLTDKVVHIRAERRNGAKPRTVLFVTVRAHDIHPYDDYFKKFAPLTGVGQPEPLRVNKNCIFTMSPNLSVVIKPLYQSRL